MRCNPVIWTSFLLTRFWKVEEGQRFCCEGCINISAKWESIMETFYLKDMQSYIFFPIVPWLLKEPRPRQVEQNPDESYINHYSLVLLCVNWIYVHKSKDSVMCQWNRQYYGRKLYWHFLFLHKCTWLHIEFKAISFHPPTYPHMHSLKH